MEIYLYNASWEQIGIVDDYTSLIWRRRYYSCGDFELYCNTKMYALFSQTEYVMRNDTDEIGVREELLIDDTQAVIKGRFIESLLSRRVISSQQDFSNKTQGQIAVSLISTFCPFLTAQASTAGESTSKQVTGDNVMDCTYELLQEAELSQRIRRVNGTLTYEVWQGVNRTQSQNVNSWAAFSPDWDNLISFSYDYSNKDIKNYAYVAGEGEGSDRVIVTVDQTGGGDRRELWVDARDLRKDDMTTAEYKKVLAQRGKEKLAEYGLVEKVNADVDTQAKSLRYRIDYDLGDLCTVTRPEYGLTVEKRIEQIDEVFEKGSMSIKPTFGTGFLLLPQYIKRELSR